MALAGVKGRKIRSPSKESNFVCAPLAHERKSRYEGSFSERLSTVEAVLLGSKWSVSFKRIVVQDAMTKVFEVYLEMPGTIKKRSVNTKWRWQLRDSVRAGKADVMRT